MQNAPPNNARLPFLPFLVSIPMCTFWTGWAHVGALCVVPGIYTMRSNQESSSIMCNSVTACYMKSHVGISLAAMTGMLKRPI